MALISCPECSKQVSTQAQSCPNCGYPLRRTEERYHTVTHFGSVSSSGQDELDSLLASGWEIVYDEVVDEWTDGDGYQCIQYRYKLRKEC